MKIKLLFTMLLLTQWLWAQNMTVASFTASTDVDASVHRVNDLNGQACALVKVMVTDEVTDAKGASVISQQGNRSFTKHGSNEYWVYLAKGARHLTVATQNHLPLKVIFGDYGITTLESLTTYVLQLNANKQAQRQKLTIKYSPSDAVVLIDAKVCQGQNGIYQTSLAPGNYKVIVSRSGYNPFSVTAEITDSPVSLYAYLDKVDKATEEETVTPQTTVTPQATVTQQSAVTPQTVVTPQSTINQEASYTPSPDGIETFTVNGVTFNMVRVDGGTFQMGSNDSEAKSDERPVHQVTLSTYYIGETEVTQALWQAVMGNNPSNWKGSNLPVEKVSLEDCQRFVRELNRMTGKNFRLPTEAEWEFAARGGNKSTGCKYSGSNAIDNVAWYDGNSDSRTHDVKTKSPNELGIYDMSGNVWEWCQDKYTLYSRSSQTDPTGPSSTLIWGHRVYRGGSWNSDARNCRSSRRDHYSSYRHKTLGLRLAL